VDGYGFILLLLILVGAWLLMEGALIHYNPIGRVLERAEDHLDNPKTGSTRRRFWWMVRSVMVAAACTLSVLFAWHTLIRPQTTKPQPALTEVLIDKGADLARWAATQAAEHPETAKRVLRNPAETG